MIHCTICGSKISMRVHDLDCNSIILVVNTINYLLRKGNIIYFVGNSQSDQGKKGFTNGS